ncbi:MAG TPA: FAD-dependent monooxygenase [Microbacteriaceae bacterium]|nr:FAD-dependent monooxygenase [Microbacteriaceae bacterium]
MTHSAAADVVIVGNGPVGQTTALLLANLGIRVAIVDKAAARMPVGSKATTHRPNNLDIWDIVGAGSRMVAEGVAKVNSHVFYQDEHLFTESYDDGAAKQYPPMITISQERVEAILDELIAEQPLISVHWNHDFVHFAQDSDGVTVHCRQAGGAETSFRGAFAVACVGSRADAVHADLDVSFDGRRFDDKFLICDLTIPSAHWERDRFFHFDSQHNPGRQILIQPCPNSSYRIDWQLPYEYDLDEDIASGGLDRRIRAVTGDRDYGINWTSVYRFQARLASSFRVGRVFLAGDCAHLMSPFGGRGLNSGVCDAENLAWKLAFVIKGWAPEALLDTYDEERAAAAFENLTVTASTMDFLVPQNDEQRARRIELLEAARDRPGAETWSQIDTSRMAEAFWYFDSSLTTPDQSRPAPVEPPRGIVPRPGPGVLIPDLMIDIDGVPTRIRNLVRGRYTLLVEGPAAAAGSLQPNSGTYAIVAFSDIDPQGTLRELLAVAPGEIWIVRPDAYVAAVVQDNDIDRARRLADLSDENNPGLQGPTAPRPQWMPATA